MEIIESILNNNAFQFFSLMVIGPILAVSVVIWIKGKQWGYLQKIINPIRKILLDCFKKLKKESDHVSWN